MCGISGWFSSHPIDDSAAARLRAMTAAIAHRGPDASDQRLFEHAALGHARLSIIDLDHGQQPMQDGPLTLIFNGEIYNYRELRSQLVAKGIRVALDSDTAVLLALLRHEGPAGLKKLRGMYALACWNEQTKSGFLARDPFGIKPLFVARTADSLLFGSEAKAILASRQLESRLSEGSLHLLLNFRYLPGRHSLFQGIEQLEPGEVLHWQKDADTRSEFIKWSDSPDAPPDANPMNALQNSVAAHCIADVPVGVYLSGGLDSASVAHFARQAGNAPQTSFTLDVGDDPQEARYAARSAELFALSNQQQRVEIDAETDLRQLIRHLEVPKINALQGSLLARSAAGQVKVVLSGLGGDELFLGYNAHRIVAQMADLHRRVPGFARRSAASIGLPFARLLGSNSEPERGLEMVRHLGDWPRVYGLLRNLWDTPALRDEIYGERMLDAEQDTRLPDAWDDLSERWPNDEPDPVEAMRRFEWRNKMVNDLLWNEDRVSMAVGLEVRVPFVDRQLAASLSAHNRHALMPDNRPKQQMRDWLKPLLPAEILNRPKSGFQVHAGEFFQRHLSQLADEVLSESRLREHGLFNPAYVAKLRRLSPGKAHRWHYFMLYLMLLTHLWLDEFE